MMLAPAHLFTSRADVHRRAVVRDRAGSAVSEWRPVAMMVSCRVSGYGGSLAAAAEREQASGNVAVYFAGGVDVVPGDRLEIDDRWFEVRAVKRFGSFASPPYLRADCIESAEGTTDD